MLKSEVINVLLVQTVLKTGIVCIEAADLFILDGFHFCVCFNFLLPSMYVFELLKGELKSINKLFLTEEFIWKRRINYTECLVQEAYSTPEGAIPSVR